MNIIYFHYFLIHDIIIVCEITWCVINKIEIESDHGIAKHHQFATVIGPFLLPSL